MMASTKMGINKRILKFDLSICQTTYEPESSVSLYTEHVSACRYNFWTYSGRIDHQCRFNSNLGSPWPGCQGLFLREVPLTPTGCQQLRVPIATSNGFHLKSRNIPWCKALHFFLERCITICCQKQKKLSKSELFLFWNFFRLPLDLGLFVESFECPRLGDLTGRRRP